MPNFRYTLWQDLSAAQGSDAVVLGYTQDTWNLPASAPIEALSFETIMLESPFAQRNALVNLGYDEPRYDCWINHYEDYFWFELEEESVDRYFAVLGWNPSMWDGMGDLPDTEEEEWDKLSDEERAAASQICYFEETWNEEESMEEWDRLPRVPTPRPTLQPTPRPTPMPTTAFPTQVASLHPSLSPTSSTMPSFDPSESPSLAPTITPIPTNSPTFMPTGCTTLFRRCEVAELCCTGTCRRGRCRIFGNSDV